MALLTTEPCPEAMTSTDNAAQDFDAELAPLLLDAVRLATGMLMNATEAEDAVQEACLSAWHGRSNRRSGSDLRPWFLAIVANKCRDVRRNRWWRVVRFADLPSAERSAPDPLTRLEVIGALTHLTYRVRLAVVLRYYLDLPYDAVGEAMGCSVDAAKALVRRGTASLEAALDLTEV